MPQKMIVPASDVLSITQNSSWRESRSSEGPSNKSVSPRQFPAAPVSADEVDVPPVPACPEKGKEPPGIEAPTTACPLCAVPSSVGVAGGLPVPVGIAVGSAPEDTVAPGVTVAVEVSTGAGVLVGVTTGVGEIVGTGVGGCVGVTSGDGMGDGAGVGTGVGVIAECAGEGDGRRTGVGVCCGYE